MAQTWNVGDVVKLKSGGPPMTIGAAYDSGYADCAWFDGKEAKERRFAMEGLVKADPIRSVSSPRKGR